MYENETGINGRGIIGGADWSAGQPNDTYQNTTGVSALSGGTIRFNRIHHNATGVSTDDGNTLHHNVIYRNTLRGVLAEGGRAEHNVAYNNAQDGIHVSGSAAIAASKTMRPTTTGRASTLSTGRAAG